MRRVCKRPIQIDALTICYEVVHPNIYEQLCDLDYNESLELHDFKLCRTDGRYYDNIYVIILNNGMREIEWGYIKFNPSKGIKQNNIHNNNELRKVWLSLKNETLYSEDISFLNNLTIKLGLEFHIITSLDLCLDTPFNVSKVVKRLLHNKDVITILNRKRIIDRDEDRPELHYPNSGSLNDLNKYQTVNIKQRNAIKDKNNGISILIYDKAAEIRNISGKLYILAYYGNPKRLYRCEVHLNADDIKNYVERRNILYTHQILFDKAVLEDMFFHFLESVIRFQSRKVDASWKHLLGRS